MTIRMWTCLAILWVAPQAAWAQHDTAAQAADTTQRSDPLARLLEESSWRLLGPPRVRGADHRPGRTRAVSQDHLRRRGVGRPVEDRERRDHLVGRRRQDRHPVHRRRRGGAVDQRLYGGAREYSSVCRGRRCGERLRVPLGVEHTDRAVAVRLHDALCGRQPSRAAQAPGSRLGAPRSRHDARRAAGAGARGRAHVVSRAVLDRRESEAAGATLRRANVVEEGWPERRLGRIRE